MGVTQDEITEVLHVAMTVGATRMQVMARAEAAKQEPAPASEPAAATVESPPAPAAGAAPETETAPAQAAGPTPSFQAAEVTAQADGG